MDQQDQADEAHGARDAAGDDREHLLRGRRHAERMPDGERRQQAEQVAEEDAEDAEVEQVRAPPQLAGAQQLRRIALPRVLVAVEAQQAAREEHGQRDVRIDAEQELIEGLHRIAPWLRQARPRHEAHDGRLRLARAAPRSAGRTEEHRLLDPFVVERRLGAPTGLCRARGARPGSPTMARTAASTAA